MPISSAIIDRWLTILHVGVFTLLAVIFGFAGLSLASCGLIGGPPSLFPSGVAIFVIGAAAYQLSMQLEQGRGYLLAATLCCLVYLLLFAWYLGGLLHPGRGEVVSFAGWWALKTSMPIIEAGILLAHRRIRRRLSALAQAAQVE